jgi:shikimate 5-dehydrogenase
MKQFFSLSKFPGKTGERYYNGMFRKLGLPYTYNALVCDNIKDGVCEMIKVGAAGFSVSMPFKSEVIKYIDAPSLNVIVHNSCNTVLINNGKLLGYNTDLAGAMYITTLFNDDADVSILGDGAMGEMFSILLPNAAVYSRKLGNWHRRYEASDVVINCTAFGTAFAGSPFVALPKVNLVIDLALKPNQLEEQCTMNGVKYVGGSAFYEEQFVKQFEIYTGRTITKELLKNI